MVKTPQNSRRRIECFLSKARWAGYALAGATATSGMGAPADADIISGYLGVKLDACHGDNNPDVFPFDVNGDGEVDMTFMHGAAGTLSGAAVVGVAGLADKRIVGRDFGFSYLYAYNLQPGVLVNQDQPFVSVGFMASYSGNSRSQFTKTGIGYVGFSFKNSEGGTHYGWLKVDMTGVPHNAYTLLDYAYEDQAGVGILVGVPEPGSLGLLATGGIGLLLWRRRRQRKLRTA